MKVYRDVIQGTTEWAALRTGIPTASNFSRILTPGGKPSRSAEPYLYELLAERMTGQPTVGYTSHWQDRGSRLEEEAVHFFEFQTDLESEKVGFICDDAETIGASPDRLVNEDGLLEIKVPMPGTHAQYLLKKSVDQDYYVQAMGQLMVSGRQWIYVMSYNPAMPAALIRLERDEAYISLLSAAVTTFSLELERQSALCIERGWLQPSWRRASGGHSTARPSAAGARLDHLAPLDELLRLAGTP